MRARPSRAMFPHRVDIYRIDTERTSRTGGNRPTATLIHGSVACLVSEKRGRRTQAGMHDLENHRVRVLFPDAIVLDQGHQIRFHQSATWRIFQVDSFHDDLNLHRLYFAECDERVEIEN